MEKAKSKDHTRVCWSCGSETMRPEENYYRCQHCGTTYCELVTLSNPTVGARIYADKPLTLRRIDKRQRDLHD